MFDRLHGNNFIKDIFRRFTKNGRLPNSLLFVGEEGIGKLQFALEIAKSFVCRDSKNGEACDECAACRRASIFAFPKADDRDAHKEIIFSEHPDIGLIIPYNRNILVDAVRKIEAESNFLPYEAKARFFIIDDAEKMNDAATNALLKTLEEPSATSHIFLISSHPNALLPTIRSRCQTIRFAPIPVKEVEDFLFHTKNTPHADAEVLANLSQGSIGRALETDLGKYREQREKMLGVLDASIHKRNRASLFKIAEELSDAKNKDSYENSLEILQTLIHDIWTLRLGGEKIVNVDLRLELLTFSKDAHLKQLAAWQSEIEILRENLSVNLNKKIATDSLFLSMANF